MDDTEDKNLASSAPKNGYADETTAANEPPTALESATSRENFLASEIPAASEINGQAKETSAAPETPAASAGWVVHDDAPSEEDPFVKDDANVAQQAETPMEQKEEAPADTADVLELGN